MATSAYMKNYMRKYYVRRKALVTQSLGGRCFVCGGTEGLSICQPPFTKVHHRFRIGWKVIRAELQYWALLCWQCQENRAPHGCIQRYWRGCRCDPCRKAMRLYHRKRRARIENRPFSEKDVLGSARHGTYSLYNKGCRCDPCRTAMREYHRGRRARIKAEELEKQARLRSSAG